MNVRILMFAGLLLAATLQAPAQSALHTIQLNGPRQHRINVVFLSEGYTAADLPAFSNHVANAVNYLFSREPWQQYRSYFNVFRIEFASNESGCDNGSAGVPRDTYFNAGFNTPSVSQLLTIDGTGQSRAYTLLNQHVPEYDLPVIIVNDTKYGGSGGAIAVASINSASAQLVEHEVGHSFAGMGDEYDIEYPAFDPAERPNVTAQTNRSLIKWLLWIDAATPVPTPETTPYDALAGLFEGAMYRTNAWYRPHNNSVMRTLGRPVGQVNRERFVVSFYTRVNPVDGFTPAQTNRAVDGFELLSFTVAPKRPRVGALQTIWKIDGVIQPGATNTNFVTSSDALFNGAHAVSATVTDGTAFVRSDPSQLLAATVTWSFTLSNQLPATLSLWRDAYGADTANPSGDGWANLLKYALRLDPATAAAAPNWPSLSVSNIAAEQYLTLVVPRRTRRADVDYQVEVSGNLAAWFSGPGNTVTNEDREDLLVVRDAVPFRGATSRFIRLNVSEKSGP